VSEQLHTLAHVLFAGFTHPAAVELAEGLLRVLPGNQRRVFYSDNGATSIEVALKMALQYFHNQGQPERRTIVAFRDSYHGDTFGAMSVSARSAFTAPFAPLLFDVQFIDVPVPGRESEAEAQLELILQTHQVAAFIFEPLVLGTAGMVMYEPAALDALISRCHAAGALAIADEVMTGFGRTGRLFASDYLIEQPDIVCLSKGLTGGTMALGATTCTAPIYEAFLSDDRTRTFFHGHSYTANPIACTAGLASLELLLTPESAADRRRVEAQHAAFARELVGVAGIRAVRQRGTILAVEFDADEATSYFSRLRDQFYALGLERGVLLRPLGNIVYVLPPYCTTDDELRLVYDTLLAMRELVLNPAAAPVAAALPEFPHD
jgi:adenosylmethionine-8-amino-7-oxononanoate aminotransferase